MGCLRVDIYPVNGLCSCVRNRNELSVKVAASQKPRIKLKLMVSCVSDFVAEIDYEKAIRLAKATSCNVPIFVKIDNYCGQILPTPYLEIEPEIIWVYPDWAVDNQVFSNTDWYIN